MRCFYINLDAAERRRSDLEASFRASAPSGWDLIRFPAHGPHEAVGLPGAQSAPAKACWLSHRAAIAATLGDVEDVFVVEDDTVFSPQAFRMIGQFLAAAPTLDIIFTDVVVTDPARMLALAKRRQALAAAGNYALQDLAETGFAAASAYVVRGTSKRRVLELLDAFTAYDVPYDVALRQLVHGQRLRAAVAFPFLTTVSAAANQSSIQPATLQFRDATLNALRRLMFVGRDMDAMRKEIGDLTAAHGDEGAALVGAVIAAMVSDSFPDG
jgi:GR25 family glycosyltransferase involved in LPS biosynthesis